MVQKSTTRRLVAIINNLHHHVASAHAEYTTTIGAPLYTLLAKRRSPDAMRPVHGPHAPCRHAHVGRVSV